MVDTILHSARLAAAITCGVEERFQAVLREQPGPSACLPDWLHPKDMLPSSRW